MTSPIKQHVCDALGLLVTLHADGSIRRQKVKQGVSDLRLEWHEVDTSILDSAVVQIATDHTGKIIVRCLDGSLWIEKPPEPNRFRLPGDVWLLIPDPYSPPPGEPARHVPF